MGVAQCQAHCGEFLFLICDVILGVFLNSYLYNVHFNVIGTVFAILGVLVSSVYQIVRHHSLPPPPPQSPVDVS